MNAAALAEWIGLAGAAAILAAYLLLQSGRLRGQDWTFLLLNLAGAAGILCSLVFRFNLAATLIESVWFAISAFGIARRLLRGRPA